MKTLTIKEFVEDQEAILKRVERGEKIAVTDGEISAVLVSSDEYIYGVELLDPPSKVQDRMIDYVDKFYNKNKDYPGHCLTGDVVEDYKLHHNPIFSWLNSQVYNQVTKYLEDLGADTSTLNIYATKAWPVVIKNGGGINYHKHQNSSLNAIYYLTSGGEGGQIQFQVTHSELNFLPFNFKEPNINQFSFVRPRPVGLPLPTEFVNSNNFTM